MTSYCNYRCEASCAHSKGMGSNDTVGLLSTNNRFRCICPRWLRVINNCNISAVALHVASGMLRAALTPSRYPFPSVAACSNKGRRSSWVSHSDICLAHIPAGISTCLNPTVFFVFSPFIFFGRITFFFAAFSAFLFPLLSLSVFPSLSPFSSYSESELSSSSSSHSSP